MFLVEMKLLWNERQFFTTWTHFCQQKISQQVKCLELNN